MLNNYSISLYQPEKKISNISFHFIIKETGMDHIEEITKKENKSFNSEKISDFLFKKINNLSIYVKKISISLITDDNQEIGSVEFLLVDTALMKKRNYSPDNFYELDIEHLNDVLNAFKKREDCLLNYENKVVIIDNIYVSPEFRDNGFGRYLFNVPVEFLSVIYHIDVNYVFFVVSPYVKKREETILKKDAGNIILKLLYLLKENGFNQYFIDDYLDKFFILKIK